MSTAAVCPLICASCGDGPGPSEPSTGKIRVSVSTTGADVPPNYSIAVGGRGEFVVAAGVPLIAPFAPGDYSLTLRVSGNCKVDGENPRAVRVVAGQTAAVSFSVTCVTATGSVRVTTVTTGVDLDRDGYQIRVEGVKASGERYLERWSLDANGTRILPAAPAGEDRVTLSGLSVNCDPVDASQRTATVAPADTVTLTFTVACAADTGQIAFVVGVPPGIRHVFVINANGTNSRRLTDATFSSDEDPAWSPNGKKIAFTTDRDGNREIYVADADGSNGSRLTNDAAADYEPVWSPDGTKIAFVSERAGAGGIFVMNADGTNQVRLTTTSARETDPAWSPDGRIAFASERDGKTADIYVMNADGSGMMRLTTGGGKHPAWSPDGTMLAYAVTYCQYYYGCYPSIVLTSKSGTQPLGPVEFGPGDRPTWSRDGRKIAYGALDCDFYYIECTPSSVLIRRIDTTDLIPVAAGQSPAWRP